MADNIKILIVEDVASDAELAKREISKTIEACVFQVVDSEIDFLDALRNFEPDIIISDYSLPGFDGMKALKLTLEFAPSIPFIIFTGSQNEDIAVNCMKAGAVDYVIKQYIKRLGPAVVQAIDKKKTQLKMSQYDVQSQKRQYFIEKIASTIPVAIYLIDIRNSEILFTNNRMSQLLGYTSNDAAYVEEIPLKKVHPEDEYKIPLLHRALDNTHDDEIVEIEYRMQNKCGDWQWFHSRDVVFERDGNGKIIQILASITDINESKLAEAELKKAHAFYKTVIDSIADGVVVYDNDLRYVLFNPAMERLSGFKLEEVIGKRPVDINPDFDKYGLESILKRAQKGEHVAVGDFYFEIAATNMKVWTSNEYFPLTETGNQINGIVGIIHNITERKLIEQELAVSEKKYRTIFENIQDIYYETSWDGTILEVSPSVSSILYSREELIGTNMLQYYANPEERANLLLAISQIGIVIDYEITLKRKDGDLAIFSITAHKLTIEDDGSNKITGTMRDITERAKSSRELLEAKEKAEEMNRLKSFFLANMSHELRTPLSGILGFSELLTTVLAGTDAQTMAQMIHKSGKRLLNTLDSILNLSRIEANKTEIQWQIIDLNKFLCEKVVHYKKIADIKNLTIDFIPSNSELLLTTDISMMDYIVNAVLDNAIKYTLQGGVEVKLERQILENIKWITIRIKDTGIGIEPGKQQVIFEPFRQVSEGYTRSFEGNGLGLTLAIKFIELLGGGIELESSSPEGTTFILKYPDSESIELAKNSEQQLSTAANRKESDFEGFSKLYKLLLIDDDNVTRIMVKCMLQNLCDIDIAESGEQALLMIEKTSYQIILLDINLGVNMNGLDVIRILRENEKYASIPIVAITAYAMTGDREKILAEGFTDYLSKPFTMTELLALIKKIFNSL